MVKHQSTLEKNLLHPGEVRTCQGCRLFGDGHIQLIILHSTLTSEMAKSLIVELCQRYEIPLP